MKKIPTRFRVRGFISSQSVQEGRDRTLVDDDD